MGYAFYIVSPEKQITTEDYENVLDNLSPFNKHGMLGNHPCDVGLHEKGYISVSGSFSISGKYAEGFVLNVVMNLLKLGYIPKVLSSDWGYGTDEEWKLIV